MEEIRMILKDLDAEILSQKEAGIDADVVEDGTTFDSGRPGIYKCVYRITPKEGDSYLVARTITVTEKETRNPGCWKFRF